MEKVLCCGKERDKNGKITQYRFKTDEGKAFKATPEQVRLAIKSNKYDFVNLKLDKAGRIIDKKRVGVDIAGQYKGNDWTQDPDELKKLTRDKEVVGWLTNELPKYYRDNAFDTKDIEYALYVDRNVPYKVKKLFNLYFDEIYNLVMFKNKYIIYQVINNEIMYGCSMPISWKRFIQGVNPSDNIIKWMLDESGNKLMNIGISIYVDLALSGCCVAFARDVDNAYECLNTIFRNYSFYGNYFDGYVTDIDGKPIYDEIKYNSIYEMYNSTFGFSKSNGRGEKIIKDYFESWNPYDI